MYMVGGMGARTSLTFGPIVWWRVLGSAFAEILLQWWVNVC